MSMVSPEMFAAECAEMSLKELLALRGRLSRDIKRYEDNKIADKEWGMCPSPDVIYQLNLLFLAKVCEELAQRAEDHSREEEMWEVPDGELSPDANVPPLGDLVSIISKKRRPRGDFETVSVDLVEASVELTVVVWPEGPREAACRASRGDLASLLQAVEDTGVLDKSQRELAEGSGGLRWRLMFVFADGVRKTLTGCGEMPEDIACVDAALGACCKE